LILDRKVAPEFNVPASFGYLKAKTERLDNGIELNYLASNSSNMLKLELVFNVGYSDCENSVIAMAVSQLLFDGTYKKSSREIAEFMDLQGAFFDVSCNPDFITISVYTLASKLKLILELLKEVLSQSSFPENEIESYKNIQKQKFYVNSEKVSYLAKNEFNKILFPQGNPYNSTLEENHFDLIKRKELLKFYEFGIKNKSFKIYASGKFDDSEKCILKESFKDWKNIESEKSKLEFNSEVTACSNIFIEKENAVQSAIRMGRLWPNKDHKDYVKLFILNTILGGYFGSRLMTNIREDKGYTYGIGSGIVSYKKGAYFVISTEVGQQYTEATLSEIEKELKNLIDTEVSKEELTLVKNYIIGSLMRNFDGAFEAIDRFKALNQMGMDYSYYDKLFQEIESVTSLELRDLAKGYFDINKMHKIIVGNKG
jgi:predicted Zn-dependent peptidase